MKYLVIETFAPECKALVYERFNQKGRMLPEGLAYVDSWLEKEGDRCFQLMETDAPGLFEKWFTRWNDLVSFEVIELEAKPTSPATYPDEH
jgi:hypothetical protein